MTLAYSFWKRMPSMAKFQQICGLASNSKDECQVPKDVCGIHHNALRWCLGRNNTIQRNYMKRVMYLHETTHAERMDMASRWKRDNLTKVPLQRPMVMISGKEYYPEPETDVYRNDLVVGTFYDQI